MKHTLRLKGIKKMVMPMAYLALGLCVVFVYDGIDFYKESVDGMFFALEIIAFLIYAYVGVLSLFGMAVMCLLAISILTCQVNLCVLCHKKKARHSRRDVVDRNGARATERRRDPRVAH